MLIYNKILPFKGYSAMAIWPFILVRGDFASPQILRHEAIHFAQQKELLIIGFYIVYIFEYLYKLVKFRNHFAAYTSISFEIEAYKNQRDINYLQKRKHFSMWEKI